jgi:hypothetical protein
VADDVIFGVTIVQLSFEDLDALPSNLRASQAPNELLALAAEHAAADDFDPAKIPALKLKLLCHKAVRIIRIFASTIILVV